LDEFGFGFEQLRKNISTCRSIWFSPAQLGGFDPQLRAETAALKQANFLRVRIWGTPKTFHLGENMVNTTGFGDASHV
jgi:hypothetical protein